MTLSFDDRIVMSDQVVTRVVGDATVLLNIGTGRYFTLDEIGASAWAALIAAPSIQQAYEQLLAQYEADPIEVRRDLESLVDSLCTQGLAEVRRA